MLALPNHDNQIKTFFPEIFRNSMLEDVFDCENKWFWRNCAKYDVGTNPDLIAGAMFAKACELTRKGFFEQGLSMFDAIELGEEYILTSNDTGHKTKSNEILADRFKRYFRKFPLNDDYRPVELADGKFAIEYTFQIELPLLHPETEKPLIFQGTLDSLVWTKSSSDQLEIIMNDEKTTDRLSRTVGGAVDLEKETNKYRLSSQILCYCWAARVLGVKVNKAHIMRVPMNTNFEESIRLEIDVSKFTVDHWYSSILERIEQLVGKYSAWKLSGETSPKTYFRPSFKNDCESYGRLCSFYIGCTQPAGERLLRGQFQQLAYHKEKRIDVPLHEYLEEIKNLYGA